MGAVASCKGLYDLYFFWTVYKKPSTASVCTSYADAVMFKQFAF